MLSDSRVLMFGSSNVDTQFSNPNTLNLSASVNFTRVFDLGANALVTEADVSSLPYMQESTTYTPSSGYNYQAMVVDLSKNTTLTSLSSNIANSATIELLFLNSLGNPDVV